MDGVAGETNEAFVADDDLPRANKTFAQTKIKKNCNDFLDCITFTKKREKLSEVVTHSDRKRF